MVSMGEQPCQYLFRQPLGKHHDQQAIVPLPAGQVHWPMPYHSFVLDLDRQVLGESYHGVSPDLW